MERETTNIQEEQTEEQKLEAARKAVEKADLDNAGGEQRLDHQTLNAPENLPVAEHGGYVSPQAQKLAEEVQHARAVTGQYRPAEGGLDGEIRENYNKLRKQGVYGYNLEGVSIDEGTRDSLKGTVEPAIRSYEVTSGTNTVNPRGAELLDMVRGGQSGMLNPEERQMARDMMEQDELRNRTDLSDKDKQRIAEYDAQVAEAEKKRLEEERIKAEYEAKERQYKELMLSLEEAKKHLDNVSLGFNEYLKDSAVKLGLDPEKSGKMTGWDEATQGAILEDIKKTELNQETVDNMVARLNILLSTVEKIKDNLLAYHERLKTAEAQLVSGNETAKAVQSQEGPENPYVNLDFDALIQNYTELNDQTDPSLEKRDNIAKVLLSKKSELESSVYVLKKEYEAAEEVQQKRQVIENMKSLQQKLEFLQTLGAKEEDILYFLKQNLTQYERETQPDVDSIYQKLEQSTVEATENLADSEEKKRQQRLEAQQLDQEARKGPDQLAQATQKLGDRITKIQDSYTSGIAAYPKEIRTMLDALQQNLSVEGIDEFVNAIDQAPEATIQARNQELLTLKEGVDDIEVNLDKIDNEIGYLEESLRSSELSTEQTLEKQVKIQEAEEIKADLLKQLVIAQTKYTEYLQQ